MATINSYISKIASLFATDNKSTIEYDLMLDYTRKLYEVILEAKQNLASDNTQSPADSASSALLSINADIHTDSTVKEESVFANISDLSQHINNDIVFQSTIANDKPFEIADNTIQHNSQFLAEPSNDFDLNNLKDAAYNMETSDENEIIQNLADKISFVVDELTIDTQTQPIPHTGISIELPTQSIPVIHKKEVIAEAIDIKDKQDTDLIEVPDISGSIDAEETAEIVSATKTPPLVAQGFIPPVHQKQKDIRLAIGINDQYLFLNELFNNNKASYEIAINKVNNFNNYIDAKEWIDDQVSFPLGWDKKDVTVQSFYQILEHHFKLK